MSKRDYWDYSVSFQRGPGHGPVDPVGLSDFVQVWTANYLSINQAVL